jgi:predicted regulator of Ras-like GTPase activity (Roadblock/LC7/MglB family)
LPANAEDILSKIDGVKGAAILKKDGSVLASRLPGGVDAKELAKRAFALMEQSAQYSEKAGYQQAGYAVASGAEGFVAVAQVSGFMLVCITSPESDIDSVVSKVRKAAEGLRELA